LVGHFEARVFALNNFGSSSLDHVLMMTMVRRVDETKMESFRPIIV
jgi:hypothetical protein